MSCSVKTPLTLTMNRMADNEANISAAGRDVSTDDDDDKSMWERTFSNRRISTVSQHPLGLSDEIPTPNHLMANVKSEPSDTTKDVPVKSTAHLSPNPVQLQIDQTHYTSDDDKKPAGRSSLASDQKDSDLTESHEDSPLLPGGVFPPPGLSESEPELPMAAGESFLSRNNSFLEDQFFPEHYPQTYAFPPQYHSNVMQHQVAVYHHLPPYPPPTVLLPSPPPASYFQSPATFAYGPGNHPFVPPPPAQGIQAEASVFRSDFPGRLTRSRVQQANQTAGPRRPLPMQGQEATALVSHYTDSRRYPVPEMRMGARRMPLAPRDEPPTPTQEELDATQSKRARDALHTWYERLAELYAYRRTHGDCNVPQQYEENRRLGVWVNKQRMEKKAWDSRHLPNQMPSSLTERKLQELERIGFIWAKPKGEQSWYEKYYELRAYMERNGHCNVPTKFGPNPALGRWVSTQRSQYKEFMKNKPTKITQRRIDMLNQLHFIWDMVARAEDE
jgi:Helicase associated domain